MKVEDLIQKNMPLIKHIANSFYQVSYDDLLQAGSIGVLKAYKKYRVNGSTKFSTYAYDYIYGEMYDFMMKDQPIKVSKEMIKLAKKIEQTRNALSLKNKKIPTYHEISLFLGLNYNLIMQAVLSSNPITSLDESVEENHSYYETIPKEETLSTIDKLTLEEGLNTLPMKEKKVILCYYLKDLTQSETAKALNMNQVMVSRKLSSGMKRLRNYYEIT